MKKSTLVNPEANTSQVALRLQQAMAENNWSIRDLSNELEMTYEYTRLVVSGRNNLAKDKIKLISARLGWDVTETLNLRAQDILRQKLGPAGAAAQVLNPEVEPFEKLFQFLEPQQKQMLIAQLHMFIEQNRRHLRGGLNIPPTE